MSDCILSKGKCNAIRSHSICSAQALWPKLLSLFLKVVVWEYWEEACILLGCGQYLSVNKWHFQSSVLILKFKQIYLWRFSLALMFYSLYLKGIVLTLCVCDLTFLIFCNQAERPCLVCYSLGLDESLLLIMALLMSFIHETEGRHFVTNGAVISIFYHFLGTFLCLSTSSVTNSLEELPIIGWQNDWGSQCVCDRQAGRQGRQAGR